MNVIPYVIDFLEYAWQKISVVSLTFLNGLTIGQYLIGIMIISWGIGLYTFFVNGFMADTSSIRAEINANKPKTVATNTTYVDTEGEYHVTHKVSTSRRVK